MQSEHILLLIHIKIMLHAQHWKASIMKRQHAVQPWRWWWTASRTISWIGFEYRRGGVLKQGAVAVSWLDEEVQAAAIFIAAWVNLKPPTHYQANNIFYCAALAYGQNSPDLLVQCQHHSLWSRLLLYAANIRLFTPGPLKWIRLLKWKGCQGGFGTWENTEIL